MSSYFSDKFKMTFSKFIRSSLIFLASFLTYILTSSATWSFRLRAVWSFPAIAPIISVNLFSIDIWISSSSILNSKVPFSISFFIRSSPFSISFCSSEEIIPCLLSILLWAILPFISSSYILLSKVIDALNFSNNLLVSLWNRPSHIFFIILVFLSFIFFLLKLKNYYFKNCIFTNIIAKKKDI